MSLTIPTHSPATGAMPHAEAHKVSSFWTLTLGSIGVVYGDIGTSPLYARLRVRAALGAKWGFVSPVLSISGSMGDVPWGRAFAPMILLRDTDLTARGRR